MRPEIISALCLNYHRLQPESQTQTSEDTAQALGKACGPDVTEIFYHSYTRVLIRDLYTFFFFILETEIPSTESWSATKAPNEIPKQFFYLKRCLVSHIVMEDENTLFACILELFKILRYCYLQRRSWSSALCFRPLTVLPLKN